MNLRLFFYFIKPRKTLYIALFLVMIVSSAFEALSLAALFPLLSSMVGGAGQDLPGIGRVVTTLSGLVPVRDPVMATALVLVGVFAARGFFGLFREALVAYASGRVLRDIKNRLIEGYSRNAYQFFLDNKIGHLIHQSLVAPGQVATLMRRLPQMAAEVLKAVALLTVLLLIFPSGMIVFGVLGLGYYQAIRYLSRKVSYNVGRERAYVRAEEHVIAYELITGIRQMIAFCTAHDWVERFKSKNRRYTSLWTKDLVWIAVPKHLMEFSAVLVLLVSLFVLRYRFSGNFVAVFPELGIFAAGLVQLLPTITELGRMRMEVLGTLPEAEAIYAAMSRASSSEHDQRGPGAPSKAKIFGRLNRGIVFKDVHFAHSDRESLLRGLSVTFQKGKVTALVGTSGAGKSTVVNLLLGLYEPSQGSILIDDVPLSDYNMGSWRSAIGFVSQDPFVIHGTIAENIVFGRHGYNEQDVITAATLANADSFIKEFPYGYQTVVGERGMKLSGGQQQRLCIARALLCKPQILLLDEATSSLDSFSERSILQTIGDIAQDRTVVQIAHRASTVARADYIVVLREGRIVEKGSHLDLIQSNGEYAKLFTTAN